MTLDLAGAFRDCYFRVPLACKVNGSHIAVGGCHGKFPENLTSGLAARDMGWEGKWQITGFDPQKFSAELGVPGSCEVMGIFKR